jgi:hypothetical protein
VVCSLHRHKHGHKAHASTNADHYVVGIDIDGYQARTHNKYMHMVKASVHVIGIARLMIANLLHYKISKLIKIIFAPDTSHMVL